MVGHELETGGGVGFENLQLSEYWTKVGHWDVDGKGVVVGAVAVLYHYDDGEERFNAGVAVAKIEGDKGVGQAGKEGYVEERVGGQDDALVAVSGQRDAMLAGRSEALVFDTEEKKGVVKVVVCDGKVGLGWMVDFEMLDGAGDFVSGCGERDAVGVDAMVKQQFDITVCRDDCCAEK